MLKLENVDAKYDSFKAMDGVSMSVEQGELVVLLGANGAGKSTLFNTISGLLKASAGKITLNGEDVTGRKPSALVQAGVVQCPEGRKLFPEMSVLKNLWLGAYVHRRDKAGMKKTLEHVLAMFPILDEKKDQPAGSLSGGQQQMVAIGRALMGRPKLLLLDEPSLGLSPRLISEIFAIIKRINVEEGMTMLLVEQNASVALPAADFGYVLETGKIRLHDTGKNLLENPDVQNAYLGG